MTTLTRPNLDGHSIRSPISTSPPLIYVARSDPDPENGVIEAELVEDEPAHHSTAIAPDAAYLYGWEAQNQFVPPSPGKNAKYYGWANPGYNARPPSDPGSDSELGLAPEPVQKSRHLLDNRSLLVALIVDKLGIHLHLFLSHKARRNLMYVLAGVLLVVIGRLDIVDLIIHVVF